MGDSRAGRGTPARAPEDCDRLFAERVNASDVEGVVGLYEERGCYVMRDRVAAGRDAIREIVNRIVAGRPVLRCDVVRVVKAGDELAVLYNDWSLSATGRDGAVVERSGRAIEVVRRQHDGTWLFVIDDPHARA